MNIFGIDFSNAPVYVLENEKITDQLLEDIQNENWVKNIHQSIVVGYVVGILGNLPGSCVRVFSFGEFDDVYIYDAAGGWVLVTSSYVYIKHLAGA